MIECYSGGGYDCVVFRLHTGSTEEEIRERLGPPASEEIESGVKEMFYPSFNLMIGLQKKKAYRFMVSENAKR